MLRAPCARHTNPELSCVRLTPRSAVRECRPAGTRTALRCVSGLLCSKRSHPSPGTHSGWCWAGNLGAPQVWKGSQSRVWLWVSGDGEQEGDGFSSSLPNSCSKCNLVKVASALAAETAALNGDDKLCAL